MNAKILAGLLLVSWLLAGVVVYLHQGKVQLVRLPPESLAQWYKPQSKRHVWLHNMFSLRRAMQAVEYYASVKQAKPLAKWTEQLKEHYLKVFEMVPEWNRRFDLHAMNALSLAQQANQFAEIPAKLDALQQGCDSCHEQFRTVTAALYRAPDFEKLTLDSTHTLSESMLVLNQQVNSIKIAYLAGDKARALTSLSELNTGINEMGALCENCHTYLPKAYPDEIMSSALEDLRLQLESGTLKEQGSALGLVAVAACAECHGTHRVAYDTRTLLNTKPGFLQLLKH